MKFWRWTVVAAAGIGFLSPLAAVESEPAAASTRTAESTRPDATARRTSVPDDAAGRATPGLPEAPFGLSWLLSRDEVTRLAADLGPLFATQFGESVVATGLPKELPDLHYSVLSFGYDDRLLRVAAIGEAAEHDRTAARATARYRELAELLEERYERVKSETHIDENYRGDRMALGFHSKKNSMYTEFAGDDLRIELSVFAEGNRTHWRLIFEYLPALREIQEHRKQLDKGAF
jgi:hypothetical protein